MLVVEVLAMTSATKERSRINRREDQDWLYRLLAELQREAAPYPGSQAVARIRVRLVAAMQTPVKAAA